MKLSKKAPAIEKLLNDISPHGRSEKHCSWCGSDKVKEEDFRNTISIREFQISGFCQKCQDNTFGKD